MKQQLEKRLIELKNEFEAGQKMLTDLDIKQANLRNSLLRISGAVQVIKEELAKYNRDNGKTAGQPDLKPAQVVELGK